MNISSLSEARGGGFPATPTRISAATSGMNRTFNGAMGASAYKSPLPVINQSVNYGSSSAMSAKLYLPHLQPKLLGSARGGPVGRNNNV